MPIIARTLKTPAVYLGFVGTLLVAWGSSNSEFAFSKFGWPDSLITAIGLTTPLPWDRIAIVLGALVLTFSWWRIRPTLQRPPRHAGLTLMLWCLPLLLCPPVLSPDAVLYADMGWEQIIGQNPYLAGLGTAGGPYAEQIDPLWAGTGVAYPPLALLLAKVCVSATGVHPYLGYIAMRIPALIGIGILLFLVPALADILKIKRRGAVFLGLLNPLLILHLVGGAHNDTPMIVFTVLAIYLAAKYPKPLMSLVVAPIVIGIAMAFKQQGGLAVVAVAGIPVVTTLIALPMAKRLWLLAWRTAVASLVTIGTFSVICIASGLGFGWISWLNLMGKAATPAPFALFPKIVAYFLGLGGIDPTDFLRITGIVTTGLLVVIVAAALVHFSDRPLTAVAWSSLALSIGGQALHPWYLPWSLVLFGLVPLTRKQRRFIYGFAVAFTLWNAIQTVIWHEANP